MAVVVPIAADYDNSGVKSAQQAFAQFGSALSKTLQQASRDARRAFGDLEDGAKDSSTAAQRLAQAIGGAADKLDTELGKSRAAAEALGEALGPELVARSGGINKIVRDLQKAGLTLEDITNEADTLAAALKKVDDVQLKNVTAQADKLDTAVKGVGDQTDRSRSVMANFTGNAAQEIPGVASAMGPLNVAIGQFAEYAAEGDINLKGFAKSIGPIAAIGAGIALVGAALKASAERAKILREDINTVRDAILEQRDAVDALAESNRLAKAVEGFDPTKGLFGSRTDLIPQLQNLGLTQEKVNDLLRGGKTALKEFASTLNKKQVFENAGAIKFLQQQVEALAKGEIEAANITEFFGQTVRRFNSSLDATAIAADAAQVAVDRKAAADEAARVAAEAAKRTEEGYARSIDSVREALYKRNNATYAAEDADLNAQEAIDAYNKAQEKANKTRNPKDIAEAARLQRDANRAINDAVGAADALAEATTSSTDATVIANARTAAAREQFDKLRLTIQEGSPLWDALQQWILLLGQVPAEITTRFGISFGSTRVPAPGRLELPQLSASAMTSSATGNVTNITINGAVDPVATATQIDKIQTRQNQRYGTGN